MNQIKHILVTGSDGFIGRELVKRLHDKGYMVYDFDRNKGDIANFSFNYNKLDHIIHLASEVFVPASWENPLIFYQTNVLGTINILELCRKKKCSVTYISSYLYGTPKYLPVDEQHPMEPSSPYNHSKFLAEEACRYYSETFHVPVVVFRPVNIYGPGQNTDFLIPKIIRQVIDPSNEKIVVNDLRPRRDFLFIEDFIDALIRSISCTGFNIFNIGSGYSMSVEEIIHVVLNLADVRKSYNSENISRKNEIWDVYLDIGKISNELGWHPITSFETGIKQCLAFYQV